MSRSGECLQAAIVTALVVGCSQAPAYDSELMIEHAGASNPTTAVDAATQKVYVAWVGTEYSVSNVYAATIDGGAQVGPLVRVNDIDGDAAPHEQAPAQIAAGPDGVVYVVWQNNMPIEGRRFPASDLRFARSTDGGRSFEPAVTVNDDAGGQPSSHTFHNMVVGSDGRIFVSWLDSRRSEMPASHSPDGEHDRHGGDDRAGPDIRIAISTDGGQSFRASTIVDRNVCPCCRTSLAIGTDGDIHVAWRKVFDGSIRDIVVATSRDGGLTFGAPVKVHDDGWVYEGCPHAGPSLAVDPYNRIHVAWYTGAASGPGLYYAASDDGARSFGPRQTLTRVITPSQARLAGDATGHTWLAWEERTAKGNSIRLGRVGADGSVASYSADAGQGRSPSVAAAGPVRAVAWLVGSDRIRIRVGGISASE